MSINSVQSFVIENYNGPTIENGLNNVCLHPLSRTFTFTSALTQRKYTIHKNLSLSAVCIICPWSLAQLLSARYRCGKSWVRFPDRSYQNSVANDSPPLRRLFGAVLAGAKARRWAPQPVTRFGVMRRV